MSVKLRAKRVLAVLMSAVLLYGGLLVSPTVAVAEQAQTSDVTTPTVRWFRVKRSRRDRWDYRHGWGLIF